MLRWQYSQLGVTETCNIQLFSCKYFLKRFRHNRTAAKVCYWKASMPEVWENRWLTFVLSIAAGTLTTSIPCRSHRRSHIQAAELVLLLITKISHLRFKIVIAERICRNRILANYSKLTVETSAKYKIFSDNRARWSSLDLIKLSLRAWFWRSRRRSEYLHIALQQCLMQRNTLGGMVQMGTLCPIVHKCFSM